MRKKINMKIYLLIKYSNIFYYAKYKERERKRMSNVNKI